MREKEAKVVYVKNEDRKAVCSECGNNNLLTLKIKEEVATCSKCGTKTKYKKCRRIDTRVKCQGRVITKKNELKLEDISLKLNGICFSGKIRLKGGEIVTLLIPVPEDKSLEEYISVTVLVVVTKENVHRCSIPENGLGKSDKKIIEKWLAEKKLK